MPIIDQELLNELITESNEHLDRIEPGFLAMESGEEVPQGLINEIFRAIHSIKGGFGFFGLNNIKSLSHKMESVLMLIRDGELAVSANVADALLAGVDKLRELIDDVGNSDEQSIEEELLPLAVILGEESAAGKSLKEKDNDKDDKNSKHVAEREFYLEKIKKNLTSGHNLFLLSLDGKKLQNNGRKIEDIINLCLEIGEVMWQSPGLQDCILTGQRESMVVSTIMEKDHLCLYLDVDSEVVEEIAQDGLAKSNDETTQEINMTAQEVEVSEPLNNEQTQSAVNEPKKEKSAAAKNASNIEVTETLRVQLPLLNRLMDLAGELVLSRNQIKQALNAKLSSTMASNNNLKDFEMKLAATQEKIMSDINEAQGGKGQYDLLKKIEHQFDRINASFRSTLGFSLIDTPGLAAIMQNVDLVTSELQSDIMNTRMQPVGSTFSKFSRVIRDIAKKLGKKIDLKIEGEDVELDKSIIELLGDPLTHLVRNCADHGIEIPADREKAGKSPIGNVSLRAYHEGGVVNIDVIDDGAGLDAEKIKKKAIEKRQISSDEAEHLTERETLALIFAPGLSTAEQVTEVSGRGVGMDVVKTNIDKLGGTIDIESTLGAGTKINLKLPLTLAIIPSMLVSLEDRLFAVPQVSIEELVRVHARDVSGRIENVQGKPVLRLREKLLPLVSLNEVLGIPKTWVDAKGNRHIDKRQSVLDRRKLGKEFSAVEDEDGLVSLHDQENSSIQDPPLNDGAVNPSEEDKKNAMEQRGQSPRRDNYRNALHVLVLKLGRNRYGLIVDKLLDNEEIVVKPLSSYLKDCKYYAGVTIMGNGNVAMILDATGVAEAAGLRFGGKLYKENEALAAKHDSESIKEKQHLLIFTNGTGERFAINLAMVARVEKVEAGRVDFIGEQEYLKYSDSSLRILRLDDFLPVQPGDRDAEKFFVIVPKLIKKPMGIVAHKLDDIVECKVKIDKGGVIAKGILGTIMLDGKINIMLDLYSLFEKADPNWEGLSPADKGIKGKKVLLAEDTAFFREVESDYITSLGCTVDLACNGREAWNKLQKNEYDLLVTDIEMPEMNGIQLTKLVRESDKLKHLPVIALTSLQMDKDRERIMASGVDSYQLKLDKEKLQESITNLVMA